MEKSILIVLISTRRASVGSVQQLFTEFGCIIKTRLGIHDGVLDKCSDTGLIIIELVGEKAQRKELSEKLAAVPGVAVKLVDITLPA